MKKIKKIAVIFFVLMLASFSYAQDEMDSSQKLASGVNPIFRDAFIADPVPIAVGNTLYIYCSEDIRDKLKARRIYAFELKERKDIFQWDGAGQDLTYSKMVLHIATVQSFSEGNYDFTIVKQSRGDTVDYAMALYGINSPKK